eukprot:GFYU01008800.1.p1 GENE.GFYU01008800.1~~GFYU01008800.1.p1  ORF type:complete len:274 (+),score=75.25 GFYU01008800.1:29-850(+)
MVLYFIGLGLGDEKDITVKGLEAVKTCSKLYLDHYTSILGVEKEKLEKFYGIEVTLAHRELVESGADEILEAGKTGNAAFLVVGDPFGATTHTDLQLRAKQMGIDVQVIHNASIMNAIGCCGLQLYRFGEAITVPFFQDDWRPDSFYDKIQANRKLGLHTLVLLDIKVREQSWENLARGREIFEPPRFMTVNQACEQLIEVEEKRQEGAYDVNETMCIGVSRVGHEDQQIISGSMKQLVDVDFGGPLHSMVIAGDMHFLEKDIVDHYKVSSGN